MIDNLDLILPLLKFEEGKFYYVQLIQREKEKKYKKLNPELVRAYIGSEEQLLEWLEVFKPIADNTGARIYINLNRRSYKTIAKQSMMKMSVMICSEQYKQVRGLYNSMCGKHSEDRGWFFVDIDSRKFDVLNKIRELIVKQKGKEPRIIEQIPTKNGYHLICNPFDSAGFMADQCTDNTVWPPAQVHKESPTVLYIPNEQ